jgi:hypothetical protein
MRLYWTVGSIVSGFLLSGCLTVTRGNTESLQIITKPPGASASAELLRQNGEKDVRENSTSREISCSPTPCSLKIPRVNHARVTVEKDGYKPVKFLAVSKGSSPTSSIRPGTIVAGHPSGSHVIAGTPQTITKYLSGNTMTAAQILTVYGIPGLFVDKATGANRSLSPNPVTVELVPVKLTPVDEEKTP